MKKPPIPKVPEIKEDTSGKNKIYYLDYFDTIKGKRQRPRVGTRRGFAEKEANRIYNEMVVHHLGLAEKTYPDIVLDDLVKLYFRSITNP